MRKSSKSLGHVQLANVILYFFYPNSLRAYSLIKMGGKTYFYSSDSYTARIYCIKDGSTILVDSNLEERRIFLLLYNILFNREGSDKGSQNKGTQNEGTQNEGTQNEDTHNEGVQNEGAQNEDTHNEGPQNEDTQKEDTQHYFGFIDNMPALLGVNYSFTYDRLDGRWPAQKNKDTIQTKFYDYSVRVTNACFECFDTVLCSMSDISLKDKYIATVFRNCGWNLPEKLKCKYDFPNISMKVKEGTANDRESTINDGVFSSIPNTTPVYEESGMLIIQQQKANTAGAVGEQNSTNGKEKAPDKVDLNNANIDKERDDSVNSATELCFPLDEALRRAFWLQQQIVLHTSCQGEFPINYYDFLVQNCRKIFSNASALNNPNFDSRVELEKYFERLRAKICKVLPEHL